MLGIALGVAVGVAVATSVGGGGAVGVGGGGGGVGVAVAVEEPQAAAATATASTAARPGSVGRLVGRSGVTAAIMQQETRSRLETKRPRLVPSRGRHSLAGYRRPPPPPKMRSSIRKMLMNSM